MADTRAISALALHMSDGTSSLRERVSVVVDILRSSAESERSLAGDDPSSPLHGLLTRRAHALDDVAFDVELLLEAMSTRRL